MRCDLGNTSVQLPLNCFSMLHTKVINMSCINSPFRYAGGKFYARNLILEHVPKHTYYIEPFAGGASIFFAKKKVEENWLNDFDKDLVNVYLTIRDKPQKLIDFLEGDKECLKLFFSHSL